MSEEAPKPSRKEQILQSLAMMLEQTPGGRITTAGLAKHVGVSEAALYRHFPSKAKMLEGLIVFAEETIFSRVSLITEEHEDAATRCRNILLLILQFVERNPGFARLFVGDVLLGETERLRARMDQLMNRIETELRQILRTHNTTREFANQLQVAAVANLMLACVEGQTVQFVRSNFSRRPTEHWDNQWTLLNDAIFS